MKRPDTPVPWRPTRAQIADAHGKRIPDVIAPGLTVLFCGINPSLYSGAVGHHFARPGNRFWKSLAAAGFTHRVLSPFEDRELLRHRLGITNLVDRATAAAVDLSDEELREGGRLLTSKIARCRPGMVAFLGMSSYRTAFAKSQASVGPQPGLIADSRVWLLPNPSGLNAHYQLDDLARVFGQLKRAVF